MHTLHSLILPTVAIFDNFHQLDNFCRSMETMGLESYHETGICFPFKAYISYDFVNKMVVVK